MKYFNLHTHRSSDRPDIVDLLNQYPWQFDESAKCYSIGIHPWYIDRERLQSDLDFIEQRISDQRCLAIGECGLDNRIGIPKELQQLVFEKQLLIAVQHRKPVILHCVAAFHELITIKNKLNITVPMIVHGFSKSSQLAKELIDNGFYLSFGKYLLRNPDLEQVFKEVPNDRFFLETDTIEEGIDEVYALAAKYKQISIEELHKIIQRNYNFVFEKQLDN